MCSFVILLLSNEMQMSVRRFSAIPHLRACNAVVSTKKNALNSEKWTIDFDQCHLQLVISKCRSGYIRLRIFASVARCSATQY